MKTLSFTLDGTPVPKARHRTGQGRTYTPAKTEAAEEAMGLLVRSKHVVFDGPVAVAIEFRVSRWRGDTDNLLKLVLDSMQKGGAIRNDRQVKRFEVEEILSDEESTTVVVSDYVQHVE